MLLILIITNVFQDYFVRFLVSLQQRTQTPPAQETKVLWSHLRSVWISAVTSSVSTGQRAGVAASLQQTRRGLINWSAMPAQSWGCPWTQCRWWENTRRQPICEPCWRTTPTECMRLLQRWAALLWQIETPKEQYQRSFLPAAVRLYNLVCSQWCLKLSLLDKALTTD